MNKMTRNGFPALFMALPAGVALQDECQRLYDAVGMWWRYSKDKDADIQTLLMRTKDRK